MINFSDYVENSKVDFKSDTSFSNLHGRFDVVVLRKSEDGGYMQFINVMYKIDSEIFPECSKKLCHKRLRNFMKTKALHRFFEEGLITFINVVPDVPE